MIVNNKIYVLLGAEGLTEAPEEWIKRVTDHKEWERVKAAQKQPPLTDVMFIDHNKRPYTLVEVLDAAPTEVKNKARIKIRCVRLED